MAASRGAKIGMTLGIAGALTGIGIGVLPLLLAPRVEPPKESFALKLDPAGPYVILATKQAARDYVAAIEKAQALHSEAKRADFDPADLTEIHATLKKWQPRYALVLIKPDELDVNFAWRWLEMTSRLDEDPFVDVRTGFITGATPDDAAAFIARTASAVEGKVKLPGAFVDDEGPPEEGDQKYFNTVAGSQDLPCWGKRLSLRMIFHGKGSFGEDRLDTMADAGLVHFGGHGHPDRIDDGVTAEQLSKLKLAPCVVFNGACYTGVTHRWYDQLGPKVVEKTVALDDSFCLRMLRGDAVAYLAALHPDHGMPVYQEMEYLAYGGGSLGDVIKNTYDGVVIAAGGKLPTFERLKDGMAPPNWEAADVMLKGTAARVLFGDPALMICDSCTPAPFTTVVKEEEGVLRATSTLANADLKSTFTDTYYNDLNTKAPFNDRALLVIDLPKGWEKVNKVEIASVRANGSPLAHRLVGHAVESDQGTWRLHVQVDVPAESYQKSAFRVSGATVELTVRKANGR